MRIVLSERVEIELERHFAYGVEKFGKPVAEKTFKRVRGFLFETLAAYPRMGIYRTRRAVYEVVIPRTPFIAFYRIEQAVEVVTVVALFHNAQNRESEWGER
jgi:plasmid stabilization system protein ParE